MSYILVVANGELKADSWLETQIAGATEVVAVDGGAEVLYALECSPNRFFGDLDSTSETVIDWLRSSDVEMHAYPKDKDETDLELALSELVSSEANEIRIVGALGARLDHELANLFLLADPRFSEHDISILSIDQTIQLVDSKFSWDGNIGDLVSLIPVAGSVMLSSSGLKWDLIDSELEFGKTRGISNVMASSRASISVDLGQIFLIKSLKNLD